MDIVAIGRCLIMAMGIRSRWVKSDEAEPGRASFYIRSAPFATKIVGDGPNGDIARQLGYGLFPR
jgi:hypothetical protein